MGEFKGHHWKKKIAASELSGHAVQQDIAKYVAWEKYHPTDTFLSHLWSLTRLISVNCSIYWSIIKLAVIIEKLSTLCL